MNTNDQSDARLFDAPANEFPRRSAPVSVIIPCYNGAATIRAAVESALTQTLPPTEVIVIDDGSSDDSGEIARRCGATVIRQDNQGLSAARNAGMEAASQQWMALLDADDIWEPDKLRQQWKAHELCPDAGLITCDFIKFVGERHVSKTFLFSSDSGYRMATRSEVAHGISRIDYFADFGSTGLYIFPSTVLVRKDVLARAGGFRPEYRIGEDIECFLRWLAITPLLVVERPLMRYRLHEHNLSKNKVGRLLSYVQTADLMASSYSHYPRGVPEWFGRMAPEKLLLAGRLALSSGDMQGARTHFLASMSRRLTFAPLAFWAVSWLGPGILKSAKRLSSGILKHPSRSNRRATIHQ